MKYNLLLALVFIQIIGISKIAFGTRHGITFANAEGKYEVQSNEIKGQVIDAVTNEPVQFANVFLNNTTIGTTTRDDGSFTLTTHNTGDYDLVVSFVGYIPIRVKITISPGVLEVGTLKLQPSVGELSTVEVLGTKDKNWEKKLKKFKKVFLGTDKSASNCTILNPWVIDFPKDSIRKKFLATANAPLEIENSALGYKINFDLTHFEADESSYTIRGNARFERMQSKEENQVIAWETNRIKAYNHSLQHLFKSMINRRINGEGFNLYTDMPGYENSTVRTASFSKELGSSLQRCDTTQLISATVQKGVYKINFAGRMEVHYRKERSATRIYTDVRYPITWINFEKKGALINKAGALLNPPYLVVSGAMSNDRVAQMLPLDYVPNLTEQIYADLEKEKTKEALHQLYEKIYLHTDKPYYYPGETIWFKGYINYSNPALRDSLSRVVYVDLIDNAARKIIDTKTFLIDSCSFIGDFLLNDTLSARDYYLRAYTNLNRNYGDEHLYSKYIPLLQLSEKPEIRTDKSLRTSEFVSITTDKAQYKVREKIKLAISIHNDEDSLQAASLSVAVTDYSQVTNIQTEQTIEEVFQINKIPESNFVNTFPIQFGLNFSASLEDTGLKGNNALVHIYQFNPPNILLSLTDDKGIFSISGLHFYDTSIFSVGFANEKGFIPTKIKLLSRNTPPVIFQKPPFTLRFETQLNPQRYKESIGLLNDSRILKEVVIKSTKIEMPVVHKQPYGKPQYVLKAKDINTSYGNLLYAIQGKFPGLIVRQSTNSGGETRWMVYVHRSSTSSILFPKEVVVLVNDVAMTGTPADVLSSINPATVESVELKTGLNSLMGGRGNSGVLYVYTKIEDEQIAAKQKTNFLKVPGYSRPSIFTSPDYSQSKVSNQKDYRSLLYWNPYLVTDALTGNTSIEFYASDKSGGYRVEVEGVTASGEPFHSEYIINVSEQ